MPELQVSVEDLARSAWKWRHLATSALFLCACLSHALLAHRRSGPD